MIDTILTILPLISCLLLLAGKLSPYKNFLLAALWLSVLTLIFHYHNSGGEILGTYFQYTHAFIYSLNMIVLLFCLIDIFTSLSKTFAKPSLQKGMTALTACSSLGVILLLSNLWLNAWFIENKKSGTTILQVANFKKPVYCKYPYVFYKMGSNGKISYLCPNAYGLLPAIGSLHQAPEYVVKQFG